MKKHGSGSVKKCSFKNKKIRGWQDVATAIEAEATLVEQLKGAELEYRIIAINKSGDGSPSNVVEVVL